MGKRIQKINCVKCKEKVNITEELELGNFDKMGNIVFVYCPYCGQEIILNNNK